ncbi:hypothetical protein [Nonomuraea sediminis]|uniref:hypothetical protein n=1 Tax=Nonomuraea sediminis TaxID=2835864 RepID=UPI001BDC3125|nr:hypothetical protein [Nonomuraea sediminis]
MYTFTIAEENTSLAWSAACRALDTPTNPRRDGFHTVVRIGDATAEDPQVRAHLDQVRQQYGYDPIETVANTIFPARLAAACSSPAELALRYRNMYPQLKRMHRRNRGGTYFGRVVAYPGEHGQVDQLSAMIDRIRTQAARTGPMSAAYEMDIAHPGDLDRDTETWSTPVHVAGKDNGYRGFPCLSHCSFQLERGQVLHAVAQYRSHYMVDRAYGNYLGLGRLLAYLAQQAQVLPGGLTVIAGHAQIEKHLTVIRPVIHNQLPIPA